MGLTRTLSLKSVGVGIVVAIVTALYLLERNDLHLGRAYSAYERHLTAPPWHGSPVAKDFTVGRIAIVHNAWYHAEVIAPIAQAIGKMMTDNVTAGQTTNATIDLDIYVEALQFGMQSLVTPFYSKEVNSADLFLHRSLALADLSPGALGVVSDEYLELQAVMRYQLIILITCDVDLPRMVRHLDILWNHSGPFRIICILHTTDDVTSLEDRAEIWHRRGALEFYTLADHTAQHAQQTLRELQNHDVRLGQVENRTGITVNSLGSRRAIWQDVKVGYIFPVLQWIDGAKKEGIKVNDSSSSRLSSVVVQGHLDPYKRDYRGLYSNVTSIVESTSEEQAGARRAFGSPKEPNIKVQLLGSDNGLPIADVLQPYITIIGGLQYPDYYNQLAQNAMLMPLFLDPMYLTAKTTSSIPSAISAGIPILADENIRKLYHYITDDAFVMRKPGEGEVDAVVRIYNEHSTNDDYSAWWQRSRAAVDQSLHLAVRDMQKKFRDALTQGLEMQIRGLSRFS